MRAGSRVPIIGLSARGFFCPHEPRIYDRTRINATRPYEAAECFRSCLDAGRPNWRTDGDRGSIPLAESRFHRTERSHRPTCANRQVGRFASQQLAVPRTHISLSPEARISESPAPQSPSGHDARHPGSWNATPLSGFRPLYRWPAAHLSKGRAASWRVRAFAARRREP